MIINHKIPIIKKVVIITASLFLILGSFETMAKTCTGRIVNPITDICWSCVLPITIGTMPVVPGVTKDTLNFPLPVCLCGVPVPRVGIAIGYWEPIRLADVTKQPFCFVGIGGVTIAPTMSIGTGSNPARGTGSENDPGTWYVHWYLYPIFSMLELVLDAICLQNGSGFDVAYITEVDPTWHDDELSFILSPESILFGNIIAQAACAADCVAASFWTAIDPLFWCAGCQGSMFPINGKVASHNSSIQSSSLVVSRMLYKMHRETLMPITSGPEAICGSIPSPMIKKSQYRTQLTIPIPTIDPITGCNPLGRSTLLWETYKEIPVVGEDFNYLIWRKRNCCAF